MGYLGGRARSGRTCAVHRTLRSFETAEAWRGSGGGCMVGKERPHGGMQGVGDNMGCMGG